MIYAVVSNTVEKRIYVDSYINELVNHKDEWEHSRNIVTCFNHGCQHMIATTAGQMYELFETFPLTYGMKISPVCSRKCAEELLAKKGEYQDLSEKAAMTRQKMRDAR